jgi:hypothetical protein
MAGGPDGSYDTAMASTVKDLTQAALAAATNQAASHAAAKATSAAISARQAAAPQLAGNEAQQGQAGPSGAL